MLTRKQFFMMTAQYCLDAARTVLDATAPRDAELPPDPCRSDDARYYAAMRNGIDPATLDINDIPHVEQGVEDAGTEHNTAIERG